jgi:hypothetical protein
MIEIGIKFALHLAINIPVPGADVCGDFTRGSAQRSRGVDFCTKTCASGARFELCSLDYNAFRLSLDFFPA